MLIVLKKIGKEETAPAVEIAKMFGKIVEIADYYIVVDTTMMKWVVEDLSIQVGLTWWIALVRSK